MGIAVGNPTKVKMNRKVVVKKPTWNAKGAGQGGDETPPIQGKQNIGETPSQGSRGAATSPQGGSKSTEDSNTPAQNASRRNFQGTGAIGLKGLIKSRLFGKKQSAK